MLFNIYVVVSVEFEILHLMQQSTFADHNVYVFGFIQFLKTTKKKPSLTAVEAGVSLSVS